MSQHFIDAKDLKQTVMCGYDRPLDNFFATVYDADEEVVHWIPGESTAAAVAKQLAPFATMSDELIETLEDERVNRATHPMTLRVDHRSVKK